MRVYQPYQPPRASDYDTWMVATTRGHIATIIPSAASTVTQRAMTRDRVHLGYKGARALRATFAGWRLDANTSGSGLEVDVPNDRAVELAIEITGAPTPVVRVTFNGGANAGVIRAGVRKYNSDPIYPAQFGLTAFTPNMAIWFRLQEQVAVGQFHIRCGPLMSISGASSKQSNGAEASQVMNEGALVTPPGGSSINAGWRPVSFEGLPLTSHGMSWANAGDSIDDGFNTVGRNAGSDGSDGLGGWFINGLYDIGSGRRVPYICFGQAGSTIKVSGPNFDKRMDFLATVTDFAEGWGTNDGGTVEGAGETAADTIARKAALRARVRARYPDIRIHARSILARVTSNNSNQFLTAAEQTPRTTAYATGGSFRDPMIATDLAALAAGAIDGYIDLNSVLCVGDKFITDGATVKLTVDDGTHPSDNGGVISGAYFASYVAALLAHQPYR